MITDHHAFALSGNRTFERVVGRPPLRLPVRMPNEACFYYVVEGRGQTFAPEGRIEQPPHEGLVLQCGSYVTEFLETSVSDTFEAIAVHLYPETLRLVYDRDFPAFLEEVDRVRPVSYSRYKSTELLRTYVNSLQFYFRNPELVSDELQKLKIKELLLLLARTDKAGAVRELIAGLFGRKQPDLRQTIENNLFNNLTVQELAVLSGMSLSSFKREFYRCFGAAPGRYIRQRRLERAARLLRRTDLRVTDIAYDCGFTEPAHFSRLFHQTYGQSPTTYRG